MTVELRPIRDQVLQRLKNWRRTGVPDWKYALLFAQSFEAVSWSWQTRCRYPDAPALAHRLAEVARLRAVGGQLTQSEADDVAEWANRLVDTYVNSIDPEHTMGYAEWYDYPIPCHVEGVRTALTQPRRAVADLLTRMEEELGELWPTVQAWWLRILLQVMECLHPTRAVAIDPRWRTSDTLGLARAISEDRAFDRLPILADALMDAGCDDDYILSHCRSDEPHPDECWALNLFGLDHRRSRHTGHESEDTAGPVRTIPRGQHPRVTNGLEAICRYAGAAHPNLILFVQTGTLQDDAHKAAVQAELAALAESVGSDAEARPLTRLLEIMPSAPVGVCVH